MKKSFLYTFAVLTVLLLFTQHSSAEAKHHHHKSSGLHVEVGSCRSCSETYVLRRYARPVVTPVYVAAPYYAAPVYVPAPYVTEEVHVVPAYRRPFAGLSLSWNFFN